MVATATRPHRLSIPRQGWAEHDPEAIWWDGVVALCRELLADGDARSGGGAASAASGPALLPPTRPFARCGRRSSTASTRARAREIAELTEELGAEAILERCGSALSTQAVGPKLLWLRRNEPEVWSGTRRLLMASSFAVRAADRRVRARPPLGQPVRPALRPRPRATGSRSGPSRSPPASSCRACSGRASRPAWSRRPPRPRRASPPGTPVMAGTIDAWAESLARRRPGGRRPDGHVRVHALPDRGHGRAAARRIPVEHGGRARGHLLAGRRPGHLGHAHWPGCATSRARPSTT